MCNLGITPDHVAFGTMINVFGKAKLFREVLQLIQETRDSVVLSDTISSLTLLSIYVENQRFVKALSLFSKMNALKCLRDLSTCNIIINVYGWLDIMKEADRLCWSMRKMGI
ncbi:Pentatricopeptide repeat [Dillenia turbinata]|uniref:Pentatricopeptide repeat n=1 Tax=Dillenia turbinata TaxID=194707 RepID=A0AAN8YXI5_9MAGN